MNLNKKNELLVYVLYIFKHKTKILIFKGTVSRFYTIWIMESDIFSTFVVKKVKIGRNCFFFKYFFTLLGAKLPYEPVGPLIHRSVIIP